MPEQGWLSERNLDLMNRALDKLLSGAESSQLETLLATNPDARRHFDSLARTVDELHSTPKAMAPARLKSVIMDQIYLRPAPSSGVPSRRFFELLQGFMPARLSFSPVFLVGSGALAGIVLILALGGFPDFWSHQTDSQSVGTMMREESPIPSEKHSSLRIGTSSVSIRLREMPSGVTLNIDGLGSALGHIELSYDASKFTIAEAPLVAAEGLTFPAAGNYRVTFKAIKTGNTGEFTVTLTEGEFSAATSMVAITSAEK